MYEADIETVRGLSSVRLSFQAGNGARLSILSASLFFIVCGVLSISREIALPMGTRRYRSDLEGVHLNEDYGDISKNLWYPQIDAVYTWVNGSDPVWLREMSQYKAEYNRQHGIVTETIEDSATSANRFRDNGELR